MQIETKFMVLKFAYLALDKLWNSFGNFLKGFVRTLYLKFLSFWPNFSSKSFLKVS